MHDLIGTQQALNATTAGLWEDYREHRDRVTTLLSSAPRADPSRLCILGAGNCNDIEIPSLLRTYSEVHLVDIDGRAISSGLARQGVREGASIRTHIHELTGVADIMAAWSSGKPVSKDDLDAAGARPLRNASAALPAPFDAVASVCTLSQLIGTVTASIGDQHPQFAEAIQAVRLGHLRTLIGLTRSSGRCILVSDIVSSETVPQLASHAKDLPRLLSALIQQRNFFHGVNPSVLAHVLRTDPTLASQVEHIDFVAPWLWNMGGKHHAVYAMAMRRHPAMAGSL